MFKPLGIISWDISKSGRKLAVLYAHIQRGDKQLAIIDLPSAKVDQDIDVPNFDSESQQSQVNVTAVRWGADDTQLLYLASGRLKQLDLTSKQTTWVADCSRCESFATHPTGFTALVRAVRNGSPRQLEVISPYRQRAETVLVKEMPGGNVSFSLDGRRLAYLVLNPQPTKLSDYVIRVADLYSRKVITTSLPSRHEPSWVSSTAILVGDTHTGTLKLWLYDVVSQTQTVFVTVDTGAPEDRWITGALYRPDVPYLAFLTDYSGLHVVDLVCLHQRTGE